MSGVGRDKPISITLFINPSPTHIHPYFHPCHTSILDTSCDFAYCTSYSMSCIMYLFFRLRYPSLFKLLFVLFVTMSQSTLSQCTMRMRRKLCPSLGRSHDLVGCDFPFSACITPYCLSSGKTIVKYIWWDIPD